MVVPAAGCGARAALSGNKILAPLQGRPLLSWTLQALYAAAPTEWVIACRDDERAAVKAAFGIMQQARFVALIKRGLAPRARPIQFIEMPQSSGDAAQPRDSETGIPVVLAEGGATRQDSVLNAVRAARGEWIIVHDAARPCLSRALIEATFGAAQQTGAAIAALPVSDTVKRAAPDGSIRETLDRDEIWLAQTPQIFRREPFLAALESAARDGWQSTDCASIMERAGHRVTLVSGEAENLKVTYAADLERAALILAKRQSP